MEKIERESQPLFRELEAALLDTIRSATTADEVSRMPVDLSKLSTVLAVAIFNLSLLGRAQVYTTAQSDALAVIQAGSLEQGAGSFAELVLTEDFEPLPFEEAIAFFSDKVSLSPSEFAALEDAAKAKAFSIADGANTVVRESIRELLQRAITEGVPLREFQRNAATVLQRAGLSARAPWYWETVYRTNMQTSYQVGRYHQMRDPYVIERRPYWRYVSALLVTTRPSHAEKHGLIYPVNHRFWKSWYPPNGFNCFCTVTSVSQSLLERERWTVSDEMDFREPLPDEGFESNPALSEAV